MGILETALLDNLKNLKDVTPAVDVEKDLPYKECFASNSFFYTGHFEKEHKINYLFHLMTYQIPGTPSELTYCFSATDETDQTYYQDSRVFPLEEVTLDETSYRIVTNKGSMTGDMRTMHIKAQMEKGEIDLELTPVGLPVFNGGTGVFHMVDMDIHQYSIPKIRTKGKMVIDGVEYSIQGQEGWSWYDRQWQRNLPKSKLMRRIIGKMIGKKELILPKWGWINLNMNNGDVVSTWFAEEKDGEKSWGTYLGADGEQKKVAIEPIISQADDYWDSPHSCWSYPMTYKVQIPELNADLTVVCGTKDQELVFPGIDMYCHYEGASQISGTFKGEEMDGFCYVELIGPWKAK